MSSSINFASTSAAPAPRFSRIDLDSSSSSPSSGNNKEAVSPVPVWLYNKGARAAKAIIILHEWWGVNDSIKAQALEYFGGSGSEYLIAIIDLYRGVTTSDPGEAAHLMQKLDFTQAFRDIRALIKYIKDKEEATKIGVLGFSLGGALAMACATFFPDLSAAVVFYGMPDPRLTTPAKILIPVQFHFGAEDKLPGFSDPKVQDLIESSLVGHSIPHEFYRYNGCGHSFANPTHTDEVEVEAAAKAKERAVQFLQAKLAITS